jgi:DNA mismatch repair protein MutS2
MQFTQKTLLTLEYDKIIAMLSETALTEGAKIMAQRLMPSPEEREVRRRQRRTADARRLAEIKGYPSFGSIHDPSDSLERADKGAVLSARELLDVAKVLESARRVKEYGEADRTFETMLDDTFSYLTPNRHVEDAITRAIISEDIIADEASPALADIRRKMRAANNKIKDILQKYTSGNSRALQENIVTQRNGRYVVPVRVECRAEVAGLVHDTSSSGSTLFVEPMAVVESNNELRVLASKEEHEIERILAELSAKVSEISQTVNLNYHNLTELSFAFSCASLAMSMKAIEPEIVQQKMVHLVKARHPLLDSAKVVPISVGLGDDFDTLVITGPNTGGKTVTLKTLGLFVLMAQSGLQLPAEIGTKLGVLENVLVDIGDEQSIEQSLSTFSSHMVNIKNILESMSDCSLVLFDELGAGTDPVEGAALAAAILECVRDRGALSATTTHYAELKAFALDTNGVCNASCEFDVETLRPTYKLVIGTPGKSNAFAISEKLGIPCNVVERAKALVSSDNQRFEKVIEKLEAARIEMERDRDEAAKLRREYEQYKKSAEAELAKRLEQIEKESEDAKQKAHRLLEGARATSEYVFSELDAIKKKKDSEKFASELDEARRNLRARLRRDEELYNPVEEKTDDNYVLPRKLIRGDDVLVIDISQRGVVTSLPDKDGNLQVSAGMINIRTNIKNIKLLENEQLKKQKKQYEARRELISKTFSPELDLRGQNGEDGWFMTDKYLDDAVFAGIQSVRLIHGKGTGALRRAIWDRLKKDKRVKEYRLGMYGEGDSGVTVVELK